MANKITTLTHLEELAKRIKNHVAEEVNGLDTRLTVVEGDITTIGDTITNIEGDITNITGRLDDLDGGTDGGQSLADRVEALEDSVPDFKIQSVTPGDGFAASYQLYKKEGDGEFAPVDGSVINLAKDYFLKSAEVKTATLPDGETELPEELTSAGISEGDKYINWVIGATDGTSGDTHLYLNVGDLVTNYTSALGGAISINGSTITVNVKDENGLHINTYNQIAMNTAESATYDADGNKTAAAKAGALSSEDKEFIDSIVVATDPEVNSMLDRYFAPVSDSEP